ncbi:MAG: imidazole glycerol phosphate synthase subunit HisH [Azonexaceae bacterium]|uniref:imidazole glycerol phosphate synthase subunit HisH n=1 Tax=Azonexus sp. R2A61 TaxID=2744443 RepID=UPI001F1B2280|nr:imidazole glycerol phosphate synthase subunit HisH [Azonexus sp. R2A61]MCE1239259.1 imidazole glycerol phosphate synthase subunit HisH [Azonexaceae bacterium]
MAGRTIAVIDYGMGNLRSAAKAVEHVADGATVVVTADPAVVAAAERVVFPGQGAMPDCMRELEARGLRQAVLDAARDKPFLGICVGEQMLFEKSEEGDVAGLGIFPGVIRRFPDERMVDRKGDRLKVPHMGWNEVWQKPHALWQGIADGARFYFVHSYCLQAIDPALTIGTTDYGVPFTCAVGRDNIFAVQFHPEKSARDGLQLLKNFVEWRP